MYLKQVTVLNMQSIQNYTITLPPTGLVVFTGENSNGKSIITRCTRHLIDGSLRKPVKRASLVNRSAQFGEITYIRSDDVRLTLHLTREASGTYVVYAEPAREPIARYLSDKSYQELVRRFGWHYDESTGITLNIAEAESALLFYKTPYKSNASLIHSATMDTHANAVAEGIEMTIDETRKSRDGEAQKLRTIAATLQSLHAEDVEPLREQMAVLGKLYKTLSKIYIPTIPEIKPVPKVHYTNVYFPTLPAVKYPRIIDVHCEIPDIVPIATDLQALRERKCPTCGRGWDCAC